MVILPKENNSAADSSPARPAPAEETLLDRLSAAVYTCDAHGRITYCNRAAEELWGRSPEIGKDRWSGAFAMAKMDGTPLPAECGPMALTMLGESTEREHSLVITRPDATQRIVTVHPQVLHNQAGEVVGGINMFTDITEKVRAEVAEHSSELTLSRLISLLPVGVASCDMQGRISFFNQIAADLCGEPPADGDLFGCLSAFRFLLPGSTEPIALNREALVTWCGKGDSLRDVELFLERPDGSRTVLNITVEALRDDSGAPAGAVAAFQDITQRQHVERAVRHLASIVEFSEDAIISKDLDGHITSWNRAAERLFGYAPDEVLGKAVSLLIPEDRTDEEPTILSRIRSGERVLPYETIRQRKDGSLIDISIAVSPIKDEHGHIVGASKIARDIRRIKEFEARLKEEDQRKNEFLATLAHELRNPLAPLRYALQIIAQDPADIEAVTESRGIMERQLGQMVRLVDDLLDMSRITRGKFHLRLARADVREIVKSALESCRPIIHEACHELTTDLPGERVEILADATRLSQVIINLLSNSVKYTEPGGRIHLAVKTSEQDLMLTVSDNGMGIDKELLPKVFHPFHQADHPSEKSQGGLGIGLTLVRRLVEMHHGSIRAHSEGLGKGSTFTVSIPLKPPIALPTASVASRVPSAPSRTGRRVLIADDNQDAAISLAHLLRLRGHETEIAYDGIEAVERALEFKPEAVVLDIGMPRLTGHEAGRRIRDQLAGSQPILIALTGWGQEDDRRMSLEAGFDHHLVKPIDFRALEAILATD